MRITGRRRLLGIFLAVFMVVTLLMMYNPSSPGTSVSHPVKGVYEELHLIFATDLHYLAPGLVSDRDAFEEILLQGDGKLTHYSQEIVEAFLAEIIAQAPDVLILGGDLTFNGEKASHEGLAEMLSPVREAGIPVLVVPGNHDINNPRPYRYTNDGVQPVGSISDTAFQKLYSPLGAVDAASFDKHSLSYLYPLAEDVQLLMLDSCLYEPGRVKAGGRIPDGTLRWMEDCLSNAQRDNITVITVMHHNLLPHNPLFSTGFTIENDEPVVELLEKYAVPLNLSGHMHIQHMTRSGGQNSVYDIATNALSVSPNCYGDIRIDGERQIVYQAISVDVAGWADGHGLLDEKLLSFPRYAREFMAQTTALQVEQTLAAYELTGEQKERMIALAQDVNIRYFSGIPMDSTLDEAAYRLWQDHCPDSFFAIYLKTMVEETADSRSLTIVR